jgi:hypothetical protein
MVLCDLPWSPHTIVICPFCVGDHVNMSISSIRLDVDYFFSPSLPPKHLTIKKKFGSSSFDDLNYLITIISMIKIIWS